MVKNSLSISIMAHPVRYFEACKLRDKLPILSPISLDTGIGLMENFMQAWRYYDAAATFHLVLQDDAILCHDFYRKIERYLSLRGNTDYAYSFYFGDEPYSAEWMKVVRMDELIAREPRWGVAICLPTKLIPDMLEFCRKETSAHETIRIGKFLKSKGISTIFPIPSLVDHKAGDSLFGANGSKSRAPLFIDNHNQ